MCRLGLLEAGWRQRPAAEVQAFRWEEPAVHRSLAQLFMSRWQGLQQLDPRAAPSKEISMCTHAAWVYPLPAEVGGFSRAAAPPHTKILASFSVLQNYFQLRVGCAHLEVEQGRKGHQAPRAERLCRLCSGEDASLAMRQAVIARTGTSQNVEDLKHFVLECPVYDDLRTRCAAFPSSIYTQLQSPNCVAQVFSHSAQTSLAHTLYRMKVRRAELLGLPFRF
jgi:hypothetical protein